MSDPNGRWLPIVALAEVPERGLAFSFPSAGGTESGILVRVGTGLRAWLNRCRHLAVALDREAPGDFLTRDRGHLVCGAHGALYRPGDGVCVAGPCRGAALRALTIAVRDGIVCLNIETVPAPFAKPPARP